MADVCSRAVCSSAPPDSTRPPKKCVDRSIRPSNDVPLLSPTRRPSSVIDRPSLTANLGHRRGVPRPRGSAGSSARMGSSLSVGKLGWESPHGRPVRHRAARSGLHELKTAVRSLRRFPRPVRAFGRFAPPSGVRPRPAHRGACRRTFFPRATMGTV